MKTYSLICIHGNSLSPEVFREIEVRDTEKLCLTLPGHDGFALGNINSFPQLIQNTLDQILDKNRKDIILLGLSLGGHIAHNLAYQIKSVRGVVSIAAPPLAIEKMGEAFLGHPLFGELFNPNIEPETLNSLVEVMVTKPELYPEIKRMIQVTNPSLRKILGESLSRGELSNEIELLKNFGGKKIFIHPESDHFVNGNYIKNLNLGDFYSIKGGHVLCMDNPGEINKILNSLVNELDLS